MAKKDTDVYLTDGLKGEKGTLPMQVKVVSVLTEEDGYKCWRKGACNSEATAIGWVR